MNTLVTMIIIGMSGSGSLTIDTSTTSMQQCIKVKEKMNYYSNKRLYNTADRQFSVECIENTDNQNTKKEIK